MLKRRNIQYKFIQSIFWMMYCAAFGYMTFFLQENGFAPTSIGIINAVFWLLSTILQPVLGHLTDKLKGGWRMPMIVLMAIATLTNALILLIPNAMAKGILFGTLCISIGATLPLVNTICFTCTPDGQGVNFGTARGLGSLAYAVLSAILGQLTLWVDNRIIPISLIAMTVAMLLLVVWTPYYKKTENRSEAGESSGKHAGSLWAFVRKYPFFVPVWAGALFMMIFHCMTNTYLLQIVEKSGGDSSSMGIALAIAAVIELPVMFTYAKISKKISHHALLLVAAVAFVLKGVMYYFSGNMWVVYGTQFLQMFSFAVYANAGVCYANEKLHAEDIGLGQSLIGIASSAGSLISGLLGGYLIDHYSVNWMLLVGTGIAVGGVLFLLVSYVAGRKTVSRI